MQNVLDKFNMKGRTVVVTGGGGLLGMQFALGLAQAGANVVLADLALERAQANADTLRSANLVAEAVFLDVTDPDSTKEMVIKTLERFNSLDVLVNSAALDPKFDPQHQREQSANAFETYALDLWQKALDVNLTGLFLTSQAAVQPMLAQGRGVIINICSIYGLNGPDQRIYKRADGTQSYKPVYYPVTKAGVLGFTRYLAAYYAGRNIRVNALTPGGVFNQHDEEFAHSYSTRTILGRMADLDEMNAAILFLASDASSYMTGANLVVDGGWTAW